MSVYIEGQTIQFRASFTDKDGVATDPTQIQVTILEPDGTSTNYLYNTDPEVIKESTGVYYINRPANQQKKWRHRWQGDGAILAVAEATVLVEPSRVVG
jgi:hypothetical protein